jgi:hypothetical protein
LHRNNRTSQVADGESTVGILFLKRELGRGTYGMRRLVRYVELLIAECDFPPPLPEMVKDRLELGVTEHSVWRRAPVEAWIEDLLPPANAAALDAREAAAAAEDMDAAAGNLRLVSAR